jgi:hypothetical protein
MKAIKKAAHIGHPDNSVKQHKGNKITVSTKLRFYNGCRVAAMGHLPDHIKRLIILKIAAFEIQIEELINQHNRKGGGPS